MKKTKKPIKLIPPDPDRCQAQTLEGSFMTLGPRSMERCKNKPTVIVTENKPKPGEPAGAMSLCPDCHEEFKRRMPKGYATAKKIKPKKKS